MSYSMGEKNFDVRTSQNHTIQNPIRVAQLPQRGTFSKGNFPSEGLAAKIIGNTQTKMARIVFHHE
jgi:hypothetical protein